jgi:hypothetical protein
MQLQNYLACLLGDRGHWLAERNVHRVEIGSDFNRRSMSEMKAKQSFIAFLDANQPSVERDDDTAVMAAVNTGLTSVFSRFGK